MNQLASSLCGLHGERVALCGVAVSAVLDELLAEIAVTQTYRNSTFTNIEAVYTFPLPLDAVLLEFEVVIGKRRLAGTVVEKRAAEERYEDAIQTGDAAVMLETIEPGLYTMNVGNLLPSETIQVNFRYALVTRWSGQHLRIMLPMCIAPRYGHSPHSPHQAPETSLLVENQFCLRLELLGALREAQFDCASHALERLHLPDKLVLSLAQHGAAMDRDFVLNIHTPQAWRNFVLCGRDGEGAAALLSFSPFFPGLRQARALSLAVVIDCSGSMQGDSMLQARRALEEILAGLQAQDRLALIAFGSTLRSLAEGLLPCNAKNLAAARHFAASLDANLGGTEIGPALQAAYAAAGRSETLDILLVTDGEVAAWQPLVDRARHSGHRLFTVGVGSAVSEAFLRQLAAATRGACELVSPREDMAERIVRQFNRLRAPRARRVTVQWPAGSADIFPAHIGALFDGDTVLASARLPRLDAAASVSIEVETDSGEVMRQAMSLPAPAAVAAADDPSTVARVAAALRLAQLDDAGAAIATALRYRLLSPWSNWLLVAPRAEGERTTELPLLHKVTQSLAAGWGGIGSVHADLPITYGDASFMLLSHESAAGEDLPPLLPAFHTLIQLIESDTSRLDAVAALELLRDCGLTDELAEIFLRASELGIRAEALAAIILAKLLGRSLARYLSRAAKTRLTALRTHSRRTSTLLRALGQQGEAQSSAVRIAVESAVLVEEPQAEHWQRFTQVGGLLDELERRLRRLRRQGEWYLCGGASIGDVVLVSCS